MKRPLLGLVAVLLLAPRLAEADTRAEARRYFTRGMEAIESGRPREGIDLLLRAYAIKPHPNVLFNVARAYNSLNELERAIEYFERYLESDPPDAAEVEPVLDDLRERTKLRVLVDQGMAAIAAGRHLEGVALLQRAYAARPHPNLLYNIGRAYEDAGDANSAIDAYRAYLASGPSDAGTVEARVSALTARLESAPPREPTRVPREAPPVDEARLAERIAQLLREKPGGVAPPVVPLVAPSVEPLATSTGAAGGEKLEAKETAGYEEVVVAASRREQSPLDAPNAVTVLTEEDIRLSGARTIPDLLRRVPGMDVMTMTTADQNVSMRGFNRRLANKILVLVDGRSVYQDFLGAVLWRSLEIDLEDIARIEVVRGPGSAIYGAYAYTGIVDIITKKPEEIGGSVAKVTAGGGKMIDALYQYGDRKGPLGLRFSAGFTQAGKYDREFGADRVDYTTDFAAADLSYRRVRFDGTADWTLKSGGRFFAGGGASNGVQELYAVSVLRNQHTDGLIANVRAGYSDDLFSLLAVWNGTRVDSAPEYHRVGLPSLGSSVIADSFSVEPVFRPVFSLLGEHALVVGAEYRHKFIDWNYLNDEVREDHFAIFAQDAWALSSSFTALVSARVDKHPLIGFLGSPRLALIFKPSTRSAIRASLGTAYRQPTQAETYLDLSASSPVAGVAVTLVGGGDQLSPERIATLDVGYLQQTDFGELELVGYLNRVTGLIIPGAFAATSPAQGFDSGVGAFIGAESLYYNNPTVYLAMGGEVSTRLYPIDGVDVGASYAFQYIFDQETGDRFTDAPMHKVTVWGQLRTRFGLDLGVSLHYVSAQEWVEPAFDPEDPSGFDSTPLPIDAFVVLIGRVGYRLFDDHLELAVAGTNLADTGQSRHQEHPFGNRVEARVVGSATWRF